MTYMPSAVIANLLANQLEVGEEVFPRELASSTGAVVPSSGQLRMTNFSARKSETTTQVRVYSGATAAAATPTLCRIGMYLLDSSGDGTLVAATDNDTTLFASTLTAYTRSWATPYAKVAGQRYAIGVLVVSATTMPSLHGHPLGALSGSEVGVAPALGGMLTGQADLPASFTAGSLIGNGQRPYLVVLP